MVITKILSGFFVKAITGFDDTMVHIPIVGTITRTRRGKIAFSLGILIAVTLAVTIAVLFASAIRLMPYSRHISSGLLFLLATIIYFNIIIAKPKQKVEQKLQAKQVKTISPKRFFKLIGIGFIAAFATLIDDIIAYSSVFSGSLSFFPYIVLGIYIATFLELYAIIYFSRKLAKIPYKRQATSFGLVILGYLILFRVI